MKSVETHPEKTTAATTIATTNTTIRKIYVNKNVNKNNDHRFVQLKTQGYHPWRYRQTSWNFVGVSILGSVSPTGWDEKTLNDERWFPRPQLRTTTICWWQFLPKVFALVEKQPKHVVCEKLPQEGVFPTSGSFKYFKSNPMNTWFMWGTRRYTFAASLWCYEFLLFLLIFTISFELDDVYRILFTRNVDPKVFPGTGLCFLARVVLVAGAFSGGKYKFEKTAKL